MSASMTVKINPTNVYEIPENAIFRMKGNEFGVYLALMYLQRRGEVTSYRAIEAVTKIASKTIREALCRLRTRKWLTWEPQSVRSIGITGSLPNEYTLFTDGE